MPRNLGRVVRTVLNADFHYRLAAAPAWPTVVPAAASVLTMDYAQQESLKLNEGICVRALSSRRRDDLHERPPKSRSNNMPATRPTPATSSAAASAAMRRHCAPFTMKITRDQVPAPEMSLRGYRVGRILRNTPPATTWNSSSLRQ